MRLTKLWQRSKTVSKGALCPTVASNAWGECSLPPGRASQAVPAVAPWLLRLLLVSSRRGGAPRERAPPVRGPALPPAGAAAAPSPACTGRALPGHRPPTRRTPPQTRACYHPPLDLRPVATLCPTGVGKCSLGQRLATEGVQSEQLHVPSNLHFSHTATQEPRPPFSSCMQYNSFSLSNVCFWTSV